MYESTIWYPTNNGDINNIEKMQFEFPRFVSYKTADLMHRFSHNYEKILDVTKLNTLEKSRIHSAACLYTKF